MGRLGALQGDAVLYGALGGVRAAVSGWTSQEPAQWHWGYLAAGPYARAALAAPGWLDRRCVARRRSCVVVLLASSWRERSPCPLGLEARWRHDATTGRATPSPRSR